MNNFFERRFVIQTIFIIAMFMLLARLFYIQIIDRTYFLASENNVLRKVIVYPARGVVLDRNGKILVENTPVYDLMVTPREVKAFDTVGLCKLLGVDLQEFERRFDDAKDNSPRKPFIIEKQLSIETYARLQERLFAFKGFYVENRTVRYYPRAIAAQLLGYVGEVDDKMIKKENGFYHQGDYIGLSGIEGSYETILRGQRGVRNVLYDVHNVEKGSYENGKYDTLAVSGEKLISTINADLQAYGERLMKNKLGSIVVIEPQTGEILALVSSPTYDPNLLVGRERGHNFSKLYQDPYIPLYMRPLQAYYPPGSTFKPVQALIGQQEKLIEPSTVFPGGVGYYAGNHLVKNFHPIPPLDLKGAIEYSSNSYFCHVFHDIIEKGVNQGVSGNFLQWRNYVSEFGFGNPLGIDLPNEKRGRVPTPALYDKVHGKGHWNSNTIISLAIGQGELDVTPLQMANEMAAIANKGFYYIPHLIKGIGKKDLVKSKFLEKHYVGIDPSYFDIVMDGMQLVVEKGTARAAYLPGLDICAKTGTAENPHGEDHSVFVAFAPRNNPKIAISVIVENGGQGAHWAAPIASLMIEKYLRDSISRPAYEKRMLEGSVLPPMDSHGKIIPLNPGKSKLKDSLKKKDSSKSPLKFTRKNISQSVLLSKN
jgi:penicillin-binding protein 2